MIKPRSLKRRLKRISPNWKKKINKEKEDSMLTKEVMYGLFLFKGSTLTMKKNGGHWVKDKKYLDALLPGKFATLLEYKTYEESSNPPEASCHDYTITWFHREYTLTALGKKHKKIIEDFLTMSILS